MSSILKKIKKLPNSPGVYFFLTSRKKILYIGRATSLKDRVKSYFNTDIAASRGPLIEKMFTEAGDVRCIKTDSVLEAIILEAYLIKKHQPPFNVKEKSDKSFNHVVITNEEFPRVLLIRERELKAKSCELKATYGPFPHGSLLRNALKIVRKIFPFRDTCTPQSGKPCFNRQIVLCPGICTGEVSKKEYQKTIRNIKLLFEGKKHALIKKITAEMNSAAKNKEFEIAGKIRNTIFSLKHIQDVSLIKPATHNLESKTYKIEAYDVAHMAGKHIVGVMVVSENGEMKKSDYRKFNIKTVKTGNDIGALTEIIERRLTHTEWPLPRLFVVDGGKAQIHTAEKIFQKYGIEIPTVGVVKDEHHRPKKILGDKLFISKYEKEILLANSEAHRFAITFHRKKFSYRGSTSK